MVKLLKFCFIQSEQKAVEVINSWDAGGKNKGEKKKSVGISILMYQSDTFKVAKGKANV